MNATTIALGLSILIAADTQGQPFIYSVGDGDHAEVPHEITSVGDTLYLGYVKNEVGTSFSTYQISSFGSTGQLIDSIPISLPGWAYTSSCLLRLSDDVLVSIGTWVSHSFTQNSRVGILKLDLGLSVIDSSSFPVKGNIAEIPDAVLLTDTTLGLILGRATFPSLMDTASIIVYNMTSETWVEFKNDSIYGRPRDIAWHAQSQRLVGVFTANVSLTNSAITQLLVVDPISTTASLIEIPNTMASPVVYGNIGNSTGCYFKPNGNLVVCGKVKPATGDGGTYKTGVMEVDSLYHLVNSNYIAPGDSTQDTPLYDTTVPTTQGRTVIITNKTIGAYDPFGQFLVDLYVRVLDENMNLMCSEGIVHPGYNYIRQLRRTSAGDLILTGIHVDPGATQTDALIIRMAVPDCTVGIAEIDNQNVSNVFPNPGSDHLIVESNVIDGVFRMQDMIGRSMVELRLDAWRTQVTTAFFANGMYQWTIHDEAGRSRGQGKWIKH